MNTASKHIQPPLAINILGMQTEGFEQFNLRLGNKLQEIRTSRGYYQEDVASHLGMTRVAIGYIEQGRRTPKLSTLYGMAGLYDVDIREFFSFLDDSNDTAQESSDA